MSLVTLDTNGLPEAQRFFTRIEQELKQDRKGNLKQAATLVMAAAQSAATSRRVRAGMTFDVEVNSSKDFQARIGPTRKKAFFSLRRKSQS